MSRIAEVQSELLNTAIEKWRKEELEKIEKNPSVYIKSSSNVQYMNNKLKIPGVSFSWKRALGITQLKQKIARETGIPTSKQGIERKVGKTLINMILGKKQQMYFIH